MRDMRIDRIGEQRIGEQRFDKPVAIAASAASKLEPGDDALVFDREEGWLSSAAVRVVERDDKTDYYLGNTSLARKWIGKPDFSVQFNRIADELEY